MRRQTQSSMVMIIAMAGMVGLVAFVALMVVGNIDFSPALFFAILAAGAAAVALFVGMFRDDDPDNHAARMPKPSDRDLAPKSFEPGRAGVEPGSAGVAPGSAGRSGPGATTGKFGFDATEGDKPSSAAEAPGPASAGDQAGNAPSSAHGGMPSGNATLERGNDDDARPHGRENVAIADQSDDRVHEADRGEVHVVGAKHPDHGDSGEDGTAAREQPDTVEQGAEDRRPQDHGAAGGDPSSADDGITIGTEPPRLDEPRDGDSDDLTQIDGIDGEMQTRLGKLGIFHLGQIAAWNRHEIVWMEESLGKIDGRIGREDWVNQAKSLDGGADARQDDGIGA